jgi:hypothetical protein
MADHAQAVVKAVVAAAKDGDMTAARLGARSHSPAVPRPARSAQSAADRLRRRSGAGAGREDLENWHMQHDHTAKAAA